MGQKIGPRGIELRAKREANQSAAQKFIPKIIPPLPATTGKGRPVKRKKVKR